MFVPIERSHPYARLWLLPFPAPTIEKSSGPPAGQDELGAPAGSERRRTVAPEVCEAVAPEHVQRAADPAVDADGERVVVEHLAGGRDVVVDRTVHVAGMVRQRNQPQDRLR